MITVTYCNMIMHCSMTAMLYLGLCKSTRVDYVHARVIVILFLLLRYFHFHYLCFIVCRYALFQLVLLELLG